MPDFRRINAKFGGAGDGAREGGPTGAYHGYGSGYGMAAGSPYGRTRWMPRLPGARRDWEHDAQDVDRNTVVAICLGWLQDNFCTARLQVGRYAEDGATFEPEASHWLADLLGPGGSPNDDYSAVTLFAASVLSWKADGNIFLLEGRGSGGAGAVKALWWEPHFNVTPWHDPGDTRLVSAYLVARPEGLYRLDPARVVHIRDGIDKFNPMLGVSRLKATLRNVVGYNDAETYTASIVGNMGALGGLWVPDGEDLVDEATTRNVVDTINRQTTGENSGRLAGTNVPGHVERLGLSPQEMALDTILDRPEASLCAAMGVSPMVVGMAVGAQMRSYANQKEADRQSWSNGLIPMQDRIAEGLTHRYLRGTGLVCRWDRSGVEALGEDKTEKINRAVAAYQVGLLPQNRSLALAGEAPVDGGDDRYTPGHQGPGDEGSTAGGGNGESPADEDGDGAAAGEGAEPGDGAPADPEDDEREGTTKALDADLASIAAALPTIKALAAARRPKPKAKPGGRDASGHGRRPSEEVGHFVTVRGHVIWMKGPAPADAGHPEYRKKVREAHKKHANRLRTRAAEHADRAARRRANRHLGGARELPAPRSEAHSPGNTVGAPEQAHSADREHQVAAALGGHAVGRLGGKDLPVDVALRVRRDGGVIRKGIEVKTLSKGTKDGPTMHADAKLRKAEYLARGGGRREVDTVVIDDRAAYGGGAYAGNASGHRIYYRRGAGGVDDGYRLDRMHKVKDLDELRRLVATPTDRLPEAARPPAGWPPEGQALVKLRAAAEADHAGRLRRQRAARAEGRGWKRATAVAAAR